MTDGVVVINKPKGITSHTVVQRVKRLYDAKRAGHTGTLDPIATGVLPVCLNKATKRAGEFMVGDKEYLVTILLGVSTTTYDTEGEVINRNKVPRDVIANLPEVLPEFTGVIEQRPPYFSAVKYKGRPLYKWARSGKLIDLPPRTVEVKEFSLEEIEENSVLARVVCSKGTYIRTLCHDLGKKLGVGACMKELHRLATGPFRIEDSVSLDELEKSPANGDLLKYIVSLKT